MNFCTTLSCIDGRIQLPVINFVKEYFKAEYVDNITEAGANRILAEDSKCTLAQSIFDKLDISIAIHNSIGIAVVGHHDCAGNPNTKELQEKHTLKTINVIKSIYSKTPIIGLWVDENWQVSLIQ